VKIVGRSYSLREFWILKWRIIRVIMSLRRIVNIFLLKASKFLKLASPLGYPLNILVEPSGSCNLECQKCGMLREDYRDDGLINKTKNLPLALFKKLVDEIGGTLLTIRFWHYGEPLLNPDLPLLISYAHKRKIFTVVSTALTTLNKKKAQDLIDSGLDYLLVSFDGASRDTYEKYHGRNLYDKVIEGLQIIKDLKKERNTNIPFIELQFIIMKDNESETDKVREIANKMNVDKLRFIALDVHDVNLEKFGYRSNEDILPSKKVHKLKKENLQNVNYCEVPWEESLIRYSGKVLTCATDLAQDYPLGSISKDGNYHSFKKIWKGDKYREFRVACRDKIDSIKTCQRCSRRDNSGIEELELLDP
jgi:radical SAM protein with 4Fe4S-binding SPASM domain